MDIIQASSLGPVYRSLIYPWPQSTKTEIKLIMTQPLGNNTTAKCLQSCVCEHSGVSS